MGIWDTLNGDAKIKHDESPFRRFLDHAKNGALDVTIGGLHDIGSKVGQFDNYAFTKPSDLPHGASGSRDSSNSVGTPGPSNTPDPNASKTPTPPVSPWDTARQHIADMYGDTANNDLKSHLSWQQAQLNDWGKSLNQQIANAYNNANGVASQSIANVNAAAPQMAAQVQADNTNAASAIAANNANTTQGLGSGSADALGVATAQPLAGAAADNAALLNTTGAAEAQQATSQAGLTAQDLAWLQGTNGQMTKDNQAAMQRALIGHIANASDKEFQAEQDNAKESRQNNASIDLAEARDTASNSSPDDPVASALLASTMGNKDMQNPIAGPNGKPITRIDTAQTDTPANIRMSAYGVMQSAFKSGGQAAVIPAMAKWYENQSPIYGPNTAAALSASGLPTNAADFASAYASGKL